MVLSNLASVHQSVLEYLPLHLHSWEVLRKEYLTEKAQHDHFALGQLVLMFQESAPAKVRLQSRVGGGYNSREAAQWAGSPSGRARPGVERFQSRLLQASEPLGLKAQASGYQQSLRREWIQTHVNFLSRAPRQACLDFQLVAPCYVTGRK